MQTRWKHVDGCIYVLGLYKERKDYAALLINIHDPKYFYVRRFATIRGEQALLGYVKTQRFELSVWEIRTDGVREYFRIEGDKLVPLDSENVALAVQMWRFRNGMELNFEEKENTDDRQDR